MEYSPPCLRSAAELSCLAARLARACLVAVPVVMECFGAFGTDGCKLLDKCAIKHGQRHGVESEVATWATRGFRGMYVRTAHVPGRSRSIHTACAMEILSTAKHDLAATQHAG